MSDEEQRGFRFLENDDAEAGILAYALGSGPMGEEDLAEVWARIDQAAADGRTINVYVEFGAVPDVTLKVVSDKFRRFRSLYKCIWKDRHRRRPTMAHTLREHRCATEN